MVAYNGLARATVVSRSSVSSLITFLTLSMCMSNLTIFCYIFFCLIVSGDIHPNPGPVNVPFTYCCLNSRSLLSRPDKFAALQLLATSEQYDCISITESWLNDATDDSTIKIDGYVHFRNDRATRGGGILVYIKENLVVSRLEHLDGTTTETVWLLISTKIGNIVFGTSYTPQTISENANNAELYVNYLESVFDEIENIQPKCTIFVGDFNAKNIHWGFTDRNNALGSRLYDFTIRRGLKQMIKEPTRIINNQESLLDLIFTDSPDLITDFGVTAPLHEFCDHCIIFGNFELLRCTTNHTFTKEQFDFRNVNWETLNTHLREANWENCFSNENAAENNIDKWFKLFHSILGAHIPTKKMTIKSKDKPWMTPYLKHCYNVRKRLFHKAKLLKSQLHWDRFNEADSAFTKAVQEAKADYFTHLYNQLSDPSLCRKKWWKLTKLTYGNSTKSSIPDLIVNGVIIDDLVEKCNTLNDFFSEQCTIDDSHVPLPNIPQRGPSMDAPHINVNLVLGKLKSLATSKATGPDGVPNFLLKMVAEGLAAPLAKLFNYSLEQGIFPNCWKTANVVPLYKKGEKSSPSSYRPVSLLSCASKIFEHCVADHLVEYLTSNQLISTKQSGFIPKDSTVNQLIKINDIILSAVESGKEVNAVFLDISKAFDRVWHRGLLHKLSSFGIHGTFHEWFSSYLFGRRQSVVMNGATSTLRQINAGVPQGSVLGPILFLIFINDLTEAVVSDIFLFADDSFIFDIFSDIAASIEKINSDLLEIERWAIRWLVDFNPLKTEAMTFSSKIHPSTVFNRLLFCGTFIKTVTLHKHLGVFLHSGLNWSDHVNYITSKCYNRLNLLRKLKFTLPRQTLNTLYITMIRSLMEYALVLFGGKENALMQPFEAIQYQAALIVSGAMKYSSYNKLLLELGWSKISERANYFKAVLFYKIINGLTTITFSRFVLNKCTRNEGRAELRHRPMLQAPFGRTARYCDSFIPSGCRQWNSLPDMLKESSSLLGFKSVYKSTFFKLPLHGSNIGKRHLNILHTRLRIGFVALNADLFARNLCASPNCSCSPTVETYMHYVLFCPNHNEARNTLFESLNVISDSSGINLLTFNDEVLLNHLLYGFTFPLTNYNPDIFTAFQIYIRDSGRFDRY